MDLDELRAVQTRERATDGLQELRDSFYTDVATHIQALRDERERIASETEDPFRNPKVNDLTNEIETSEQVAEAIYERRIGKLVKQASLAAAGMPDDQTGLTAEEQDLYTDLVERIRENKKTVLDVIAGEIPVEIDDEDEPEAEPEATAETEEPDPAAPPDEPDTSAASAMGGEPSEPSLSEGTEETPADEADSEQTATVDRTLVRITQDLGDIMGVDERDYSLYENDVISLPTDNADPLIEREAAEKVE